MSNYPHSSLASSFSTSPYNLQNNIEALIKRSRAQPHSRHGSASRRVSGGATGAMGTPSLESPPVISEDGASASADDLPFLHDMEDDGRGRPSVGKDADTGASGSRWRSNRYGAVSSSEPIVDPTADASSAPVPVTGGAEGNSRSRSKGRTPPRAVVRPMTLARREAAAAAGASLGALGSVHSGTDVGDSHFSVMTQDSEAPVVDNEPHQRRGSGRRGRSADRRPISPVVAFRTLPAMDEEEEAARAAQAARSNLYLPGAVGTGEPLSGDPAEELDAEDLDLPIDETGHEVHSWQGALRNELPLLLRLTFPVLFTQLAEYSLSLASVLSIGHLGTTELAASSLANMTAAVTAFSVLQGLACALDTLLPAAWTSSDPTRVGLWSQRMGVVMAAASVPMIILWWNIEGVLLALRQEPKVAELAGVYLAWLSLGIPGYAGNMVLKKYLQAQNNMEIPTYALFIVAPVNVFLNWLLVWGPEPVRLGFKGGALATAISYDLFCVFLLVYVLFIGPRDAFHPLEAQSLFSRLGTVASLGLAGTVMVSSEWWAWEVCALAASFLGSTALAAQSVCLSTCSTLFQVPAALGVATAVRVGNLLGAGRAWEAKWASRAAFILSILFALVNSAICIIFKDNWGYMFNSDPQVVAMVAAVMPWMGLFQVMDGMSGAANAVLRALALHSKGALINLSAYYLIGIPFGLWLTFSKQIHLGLVGIWIGLTVALVYSSVVSVGVVWRADWNLAVKRVRDRLGLGTLPPDPKYSDEDGVVPDERQPLLA